MLLESSVKMSSEIQQLKFAKYMEKYGRSGVTNHELARQGFLVT